MIYISSPKALWSLSSYSWKQKGSLHLLLMATPRNSAIWKSQYLRYVIGPIERRNSRMTNSFCALQHFFECKHSSTSLAFIEAKDKWTKNTYLPRQARFGTAAQVMWTCSTTMLFSKSYSRSSFWCSGAHNSTASISSALEEQYTKNPSKTTN